MVSEGEDGDGDEVLEQPPPPNPLFCPSPSGCKSPSGNTRRSAARQPLPHGLPKSSKRAVGHTDQFSLNPARVTAPCGWSCSEVFYAESGKMGRARGSGRKIPPKLAPGTGNKCRAVPCACLGGGGVSWGALGAPYLLSDPRGVRFGTGHYLVCLQHWVALGWCQQWRQGKWLQFALVWRAVPTHPYDPGAQHTYEGLVPGSRRVTGTARCAAAANAPNGRMCSELWGPSRPYKPSQRAHLTEVWWLGHEDGRIRREMGAGEAKEVKEERESASTTATTTTCFKPKPPLPPPKERPRKARVAEPPQGRRGRSCWSWTRTMSRNSLPLPLRPPPARIRRQRRKPPPPQRQRPSPPRNTRGGEKKEEGGGKEAGRGEDGGGGGGGGNDSLVGTTSHIPEGCGVQMGTVSGVHTRKSGVVWVTYPNNPKLYQVERHLIFGTAQAAEAHLQKVRKGKTPTTNPPSTKPANPPINRQENPHSHQNTPTNPPNPPNHNPRYPGTM